MVQRTVCFLVGVGFLFSCEGEQKPSMIPQMAQVRPILLT